MTYASESDLIDRFGEREIVQLTDHDGQGEIDSTVVTRSLTDADAEINGYLAARYALPLGNVPSVLVRLGADIARYYLYDDHATEQVTQRYKDAIELLRRISKGEVALGVSDDGQAPRPSEGAQMHSGGRIWDREASKGFL